MTVSEALAHERANAAGLIEDGKRLRDRSRRAIGFNDGSR